MNWIHQLTLHHNKRHPNTMGAAQVEQCLTYLANERNVSSSTKNQALSAILFLYREVLQIDLPWVKEFSHHSFATHVLNKGGKGVVSLLDGM